MSVSLPWRLSLTALALALAPLVHAQDASDAFKFKLGYTGEGAVLLDGGKDKDSAYAGQLVFGTEVDLQRLVNWNGATVKMFGVYRHGTSLTNDVGNSVSVQELYGAQGTRLVNLTLEQKLFDDRLELEAGRSGANIHFLGSELCGYFQNNAACGSPKYVFQVSNFTYWPVSSWAAHAKAWVTPKVYVHVGVYEVNPTQAEDGEHGLNWSTRDSTGVVVPYAIGYKTDAASARLPALYEIGGWQDNSDYRDPLNDRNGNPARRSGLDYASRNGRSGAFFRFEQQVTRPDADGTRGLVLFGSVLKGTSGQLIEDYFLELGLVQRGTFASRAHDNIAFVVTQQHYSDDALHDQRLARAAAGGSGTPHSSQYMMELNYGIQVSPQLRIAPNLQYIVHPDQFNEPARTRDLPNALVAGMRVDWTLL
ncbi:carbohydrate porin [Xanthomonas theicola]|uniref:Carbohydrate porin n=1 Tax=Xanthomonas theicola TaxID=56464 RepID=A0A2S6ZFF6_9XANT|nr:carbohydrate porin [Xanthomonas theicola]QNH24257.1 carbohydrate porin [Xanthomonas theicola]